MPWAYLCDPEFLTSQSLRDYDKTDGFIHDNVGVPLRATPNSNDGVHVSCGTWRFAVALSSSTLNVNCAIQLLQITCGNYPRQRGLKCERRERKRNENKWSDKYVRYGKYTGTNYRQKSLAEVTIFHVLPPRIQHLQTLSFKHD